MLRAFVVLLLLANLAFFGWSLGWLDGLVGVRARGDREPERLANQLLPETVVVLSAGSGASAVAGTSCLEAGPYTPAEAAAAEAALQGTVPATRWVDERTEKPATWLVYMGSYPDREALQRKVDEIRKQHPEIEEVKVPGEGDLGLALGRYDDRASAEKALLQVQQRGIRTARVVQLGAASIVHRLRIEHADAALAAQLAGPKFEALGKGFVACAATPPNR